MINILSLQNVSLNFDSVNKPVLNQINYEIQPGDFIILLGNNGSGKSSLLKLLYRYYQPDSGNIHFLGLPIHRHDAKAFCRQVAVLTQNCNESLFPTLTVYENYLLAKEMPAFSVTHHREERDFLQHYLQDYNPNLCGKLDVTIEKLSGGEKQVLALALCLLKPPSLLLLDEHTSALDPKTSAQIMQITERMVAKYNITCVLTTHDLYIALAYGTRVLLLQNGKIRKTYNQQEKAALTRECLLNQYY